MHILFCSERRSRVSQLRYETCLRAVHHFFFFFTFYFALLKIVFTFWLLPKSGQSPWCFHASNNETNECRRRLAHTRSNREKKKKRRDMEEKKKTAGDMTSGTLSIGLDDRWGVPRRFFSPLSDMVCVLTLRSPPKVSDQQNEEGTNQIGGWCVERERERGGQNVSPLVAAHRERLEWKQEKELV